MNGALEYGGIAAMAFDMAEFRAAMARFATGVTVVTTQVDGQFYGITVNAFCSVSLDPPLVLVSLEEGSRTRAMIQRGGVYAVNVLTSEQQALARNFATRTSDGGKTFTGIRLRQGVTGAPLFDEALVCVECRVVADYPGGDHRLLLGKVVAHDIHTERVGHGPLLYYHSRFSTLPGDTTPMPAIPVRDYLAAANGHAANGHAAPIAAEAAIRPTSDASDASGPPLAASATRRRFWFRRS